MFEGKRILVTGGTGSLGRVLVRRLLSGEMGMPKRITVFSRDEAKQHEMRLHYMGGGAATDDVIYGAASEVLTFQIGDVRDGDSLSRSVRDADIVFSAAALKQVPTCEYFPFEAVLTNVIGPENLVRAVRNVGAQVELVVGISTDKACKPVNVMGMTKAIQERIFTNANLELPATRFVCVRYGNVVASRGSVIPLFREQIARGGPLTITSSEMTRFLLDLDRAVDTIFSAARHAARGETFVPRVPSARVIDIARVLMGDQRIDIRYVGIRPGEKIHEILVSEEECNRTTIQDDCYVIRPILPELRQGETISALSAEYSSATAPLPFEELRTVLGGQLLAKAEA